MKHLCMLAAATAFLSLVGISASHALIVGDQFTCTAKGGCSKKGITGTGAGNTRPAAKTAARADLANKCSAAGGSFNASKVKYKCHKKKSTSAEGDDDKDAGDDNDGDIGLDEIL